MKNNILDNLTQYSPKQLAEFLMKDIITWDEMRATGDLTTELRKDIEEEIKWSGASSDNKIEAYKEYLEKYPSGKYVDDARNRISKLVEASNKVQMKDVNKVQVEGDWDSLNKTDIEALRNFISKHPGNPHITEARAIINKLIIDGRPLNETSRVISIIKDGYNTDRPDLNIPNELKKQLDNNRISSKDIAQVIGDDNNILEAEIVQNLCVDGIIEYNDLVKISCNRNLEIQ